MWIMVSGPYRAGKAGPGEQAENLTALNRAALALFKLGHVPVIGVNLALPMVAAAGAAAYDELMMPMSLAIAARCDACLRIGGPSEGADTEVAFFQARLLPVYHDLGEVPQPRAHRERADPT